MAQCIEYLTNSSPLPSDYCCAEVKSLNQMAHTTPNRRQLCECLKSLVKANDGFINIELVGTLPTICDVSVPYPTSLNTNCDEYLSITYFSTVLHFFVSFWNTEKPLKAFILENIFLF